MRSGWLIGLAVVFACWLIPGSPALAAPRQTNLENQQLVFDWPTAVRVDTNDVIELSINPDKNGQPAGEPMDAADRYSAYNVVALARLDLPGMADSPNEIRQPLTPGKGTEFRWKIRGTQEGFYQGMIWLHFQRVPKAGGPMDEQLVFARPVEIKVIRPTGLSPLTARLAGGLGIMAAIWIGFKPAVDWGRRGFK